MSNIKTAFGTVIYNQAWEWNKEYIESLNLQDTRDFDVIIINDGVSEERVVKLVNGIHTDIKIINVEGNTLSQNRIILIKEALKLGYDLLVFGDFDDVFSNNRISCIQKEFTCEIGFYYQEIKQFNKKNVFKTMPQITNCFDQIIEENYLGLGNTAINLHKVNEDFLDSLDDVKTNVFDWYFYARLLLYGLYGVFIKDGYTLYRQHSDNLVGDYNHQIEMIDREIKVKLEQYTLLKNYEPKLKKIIEQYELIKKEPLKEVKNKYKNPNFQGYWWSSIKCIRR